MASSSKHSSKLVVNVASSASPYNDDLGQELASGDIPYHNSPHVKKKNTGGLQGKSSNKAGDTYPSISVVSEVVQPSKPVQKRDSGVTDGGVRKQTSQSIEITDLTIERKEKLPIMMQGSDAGAGEPMSTARQMAMDNQAAMESIQSGGDGPKRSHRMNKNDLTTLTDPNNVSVIIEKDKLLEPSKDKLLDPSVDFQPEQKVQKSRRSTTRTSVINRSKQRAKEKRIGDIPEFLEQAQEIGCKCTICRQHLNQIKQDGMDPYIIEMIKYGKNQDKFLEKQLRCN